MADDVEKFLSQQKHLEEERKALIDRLQNEKTEELKKLDQQKADVAKSYDEKLRALGVGPDGAQPKRSHHPKRPAVKPSAIKAKDKEKPAS
jgi:hypothetical protein